MSARGGAIHHASQLHARSDSGSPRKRGIRMRIAYIFPENVGRASGVLKKVLGQVRTWLAIGHEVKLFCVSQRGEVWNGLRAVPAEVFFFARLWHLFRAYREMARAVAAWRPDVLYLRYGLYAPALGRLGQRYPLVLEINSNDVVERLEGAPLSIRAYRRLTRGFLLERACGHVFVAGGGLPSHRSFARFAKPRMVLGNGIGLADYPTFPAPRNEHPRLLFVGTPRQAWHGLDKMLHLARACPDWPFQLVGPTGEGMSTGLPPNVSALGYLDRSEYEDSLRSTDVALGTLALHRKRMDEASPLKVREYLACGLPTIIGYRDTDFSEERPFLLQLPNTEDNVVRHLPEIRAFVDRVKGTRVPREEVSHLDLANKEPKRLEFLAEFAGAGGRRSVRRERDLRSPV